MEEVKEYLLKQARLLSNRCGELPFNPSRWWVNSSIDPYLQVLVEYDKHVEDIKIIDRQNLYKKD